MVELGARPEVGAVGAKLLFPNGRIQHAGVVMGLFGCCGHAFKGLEGDGRHYFDLPNLVRNVSAVTGACLLVRSSVFWEVGGFDEEHFPVDYNDIDLCLRNNAIVSFILHMRCSITADQFPGARLIAMCIQPIFNASMTAGRMLLKATPFIV